MMPAETTTFLPEARPALMAGDYVLTLRQTVTDRRGGGTVLERFERTERLVVRTDRLGLDAQQVQAFYPPDGHEGRFDGDLPAVVLAQATLPWQLGVRADGTQPWLAVLLFDDLDPPPEPVQMKLSALVNGAPRTAPAFVRERGEDPDRLVTVLNLPCARFAALAPALADLNWLVHARRVAVDDKAAAGGAVPGRDYAVVAANRPCRAGRRHTAHLVSLQGMADLLPGGRGPAGDIETVRLVSLASWRFACTPAEGGFAGRLGRIDLGPMALPVPPPKPEDTAETRLVLETFARGYGAFAHRLRDDARTVSWYRGPLLPLKTSPLDIPRPASGADALLRYDPATGLFDVGYAAAWTLGRQLGLADQSFRTALGRLKNRAVRAHLLAEEQREAAGALARAATAAGPPPAPGMTRALQPAAPATAITPLPASARTGTTETAPPPDVAGLRTCLATPAAPPPEPPSAPADDEAVIAGLLARLYLLHGVPAGYLVPDPAMLPEESARFFRLDRNWVLALVDGALSLGGDVPEARGHLRQRLVGQAMAGLGDVRRSLLDEDDDDAAAPAGQPARVARMVSGLLLRSRVVEGWPGLEARAFAAARADEPLDLLRMERLAPDLLLCLFRGPLARVELIEPAEGLCFALPANAPLRPGGGVDAAALAATLKTGDAAAFAAALVRAGRVVTVAMKDQKP